MRSTRRTATFRFAPLTDGTWQDFETLFGPRGACGGCWCMTWRLKSADYERQKGAGNKKAMRRFVRAGQPVGILVYADGVPIGWCSVSPRAAFSRLNRSRLLKPVDTTPVWSIVCLFVAKPWRRTGVAGRLVKAAVEFAEKQGAQVVEAYPVEPRKDAIPDLFAFTGIAATYLRVGFVEVARRDNRPILRYKI